MKDPILFMTPGLGDNSYLFASGREAVLVDPQRDAWRFLDVVESHGLRLRYVLETHVHNDYVSGAREVQAATGAEIAAPAKGRYQFPHTPVQEGDRFDLGDLCLVPVETPGHTPEHVAWLVCERSSDKPLAVFTGGSLMVSSVGRTDLLGDDLTDQLTRAQFRSVRRLADLPDAVKVLPTHGAGSFCASTAPSAARHTTIGQERTANPALAASDEETFVRRHLSGLAEYPAYFSHIAPVNRKGPDLLGGPPSLRALSPQEVQRAAASGACVLDCRGRSQFAAAHLPGSLNVELSNAFSIYLGWVVPWNNRIVLVPPDNGTRGALEEAAIQLTRIGYDRIDGFLEGGVAAWEAAGLPLSSSRIVSVHDVLRAFRKGPEPYVLDVRQAAEWQSGHIPGSHHIFIGDLRHRLDELPRDRDVWVVCASGFRSSIAASLIAGEGIDVRVLASSGVPELLARGLSPENGPPDSAPTRP